MITWNNLDTLESYKELSNVKKVNLAEVMTGENGAAYRWQQEWYITMLQSR